ncbi:efflux RND transporter periplasmic adaptor subunit [Pseudidiomarina andamanensis]|uniref:Efflux RND transporter periplasmic adaptor subunit n=1 Tax=Pseudidiomarina andamanensis TaxID=1940690 RepID=A0AA92EUX6_9GAMM|nr:efflux RND transporter periplasmic adaptor subunit [Pseudidiomarina andamanensis]MDS0217635.1 efflux RND transporter periplasmic adaptor subunit [Pseudidiomarina andamanensis]QGT96626.1 efflux RND transporter periplasmic adaptor subunit [Pseudidiomarina andamanensis]
MRIQALLLTGVAALLANLVGCGDVAETAAREEIVQPVKLHTVNFSDDQRLRQFPAVVEAAQVAQLAFRVGGEITEFPVKAGNEVKQGELIAKLDPTDYQLVLDQAQARFELAQAQFRRTENLVEQGVISPQQFDEVKSNLEVARANLETARANVRYTELRAPFAGTIAHVFVERYETVQPQRAIATLQMNNAIDVSIRVPEGLFARVQRNTNYQPDVIFAAAPELKFKATLKEWDTTADPATNTYKVVFTLPTPENLNVLPGMSAMVSVDAQAVSQQRDAALIVPTSALFSPSTKAPEHGHFVWVYDAKTQRVNQREVTVRALTNRGAEIIEGLEAGEQIVIAGVHAISDKQRVRPWVKERGL